MIAGVSFELSSYGETLVICFYFLCMKGNLFMKEKKDTLISNSEPETEPSKDRKRKSGGCCRTNHRVRYSRMNRR